MPVVGPLTATAVIVADPVTWMPVAPPLIVHR